MTLDTFEQLANGWVDEGTLPGLQYELMRHGQIVVSASRGLSDVESGHEVTSQSLYRLASASKLYVSAAFLALVDAQVVALDQPVKQVLPGFQDLESRHADSSLLMEDLLRHSCGYGYGDTEPYGSGLRRAGLMSNDEFGMNSWVHELTLREWATRLASVPLEYTPGTKVSYGLGHDLLGAVMEALCGQRLDQIVAERLLVPLGLADTFFVAPPDRVDDLTSYYSYEDGLKLVESAAESDFLQSPASFSGGGGWDMLGNGGLISTCNDFNRLMHLLMAGGTLDGTTVLSPESCSRLKRSQTHALDSEIQPGCEYSYGVAEVVDDNRYKGQAPVGTMWWGGSTNTFYFYQPEKERSGVFMTNTFPFGWQNAIFQFEKLAAEDW